MITGIDVNSRVEFSYSKDVSEPKTIFVLKQFSGLEMIPLAKFFKNESVLLSSEAIEELLLKAIVEIRNYVEGMTVKEVINSLPVDVLSELFQEVAKINNLTNQDVKN